MESGASRAPADTEEQAITIAMSSMGGWIGPQRRDTFAVIEKILKSLCGDMRHVIDMEYSEKLEKAGAIKTASECAGEQVQPQGIGVIHNPMLPVDYPTNDYRLVFNRNGGIYGLERMWRVEQGQQDEWRLVVPGPTPGYRGGLFSGAGKGAGDITFLASGGPINPAPTKEEVENGFRRSRLREIVQKRGREFADLVVDEIFGKLDKIPPNQS